MLFLAFKITLWKFPILLNICASRLYQNSYICCFLYWEPVLGNRIRSDPVSLGHQDPDPDLGKYLILIRILYLQKDSCKFYFLVVIRCLNVVNKCHTKLFFAKHQKHIQEGFRFADLDLNKRDQICNTVENRWPLNMLQVFKSITDSDSGLKTTVWKPTLRIERVNLNKNWYICDFIKTYWQKWKKSAEFTK